MYARDHDTLCISRDHGASLPGLRSNAYVGGAYAYALQGGVQCKSGIVCAAACIFIFLYKNSCKIYSHRIHAPDQGRKHHMYSADRRACGLRRGQKRVGDIDKAPSNALLALDRA